MPYQPPLLSLSSGQSELEGQLKKLTDTRSILERIVAGESILTVAQDLSLSESQVTATLKDSLALSTEFMREQAALYQQILVQRYESLYAFAIERAMETTEEFSGKKDEDGNPIMNKVTGNLGWFEAAKKIIDSMQNLLKPYLGQEKKSGDTINITILSGTPMAEKARMILGMADMDPFDGD